MSRVPSVSVVMAAFNIANEPWPGMESVLAQTHTDFECIIVDDASNDQTPERLQQLARKDSRVRLVRLEQNLGLAGALNAGVAVATAPFVARMDHDDYALPQRFTRQLREFEAHPDVDVVSSYFLRRFVDTGDEVLVRLPIEHEDIERALSFASSMCHAGSMIKRACFTQFGGYDARFRRAQDYELWMRWRGKVRFRNIDHPLLIVYSHRYNWESKRGTTRHEVFKYQLALRLASMRRSSRYRLLDAYGLSRYCASHVRSYFLG